jgi:hypothetical protein
MTIYLVLVLIALGLSVGSATGKVPLWPAVFVLCVALLLRALPV